MARPTNQARLDRQAEEAENRIRERLVDLTEAALNAALLEPEVTCAHCKRKFKLEKVSADPQLALKLLERIAGKATEKRDTGVSGELEKLLEGLADPATAAAKQTAADAAEAAKERARKRAQIAATLKGAAVGPER